MSGKHNQPKPDNWSTGHVRLALVELLKEIGQAALSKECPLSQSVISRVVHSGLTLSKEKCSKFAIWYQQCLPELQNRSLAGLASTAPKQTYDAKFELPLLNDWFMNCKNPTDYQLELYAKELNNGHVRKERQKVTVNNLRIWWKNKRKRDKQQKKSNPFLGASSSTLADDFQPSSSLMIDKAYNSLDLALDDNELSGLMDSIEQKPL